MAFCDAAKAKVAGDLLAVDTRSRNLEEKLAVGA